MDCAQTRQLLDAYLDGELDLIRSLDVERHLRECTECSIIYENRQRLREELGHDHLYFKAPPELQKRIRRSLGQPRSSLPPRWMVLAAALVFMVLVGWIALKPGLMPYDERLFDEVLASHIRSLMVEHLQDIVSTDQHTVKPWFDGKLDFSPPVVDLANEGFPLLGGRLDYVDHRAVAALVYRRNKHIINLFVWPTDQTPPPFSITRQGYHVVQWTEQGMAFWLVSDVSESDLAVFAQQLQSALRQAGGSPEPHMN
jgi:anti-sigma factor RsiW